MADEMGNEILTYLSKYIPISPELAKAITESSFIQYFKKGTLLLKEGEFSHECYLVIKGCVRTYYIKDGEEKTVDFHTEEQSLTPSVYGKKLRSEYYIQCVEDTLAGVGTPKKEMEFYLNFPELESLVRALGEAVMVKNQDIFAEFKMASPEERYLNLLEKRPDLIQRVPQHQIASYLGMKPESLSRIRRRITK